MVADVAVFLLDREGQVPAREELLGRDQPLETFPIIRHEGAAVDAGLAEKYPTGLVITPAQVPGRGSPCHRIKGPPDPNLVFSRPRSATSRRSARCRPREWSKAPGHPRRPRGSTCRPRRG